MVLLLTEMMARRGCGLKQLVRDLEKRIGTLYYNRRDLRLESETVMDRFRAALPTLAPIAVAGATVEECVHTDGAKFLLPDDEWLLLRASGTEPLVRIYAEAGTPQRVDELLTAGNELVQEAGS